MDNGRHLANIKSLIANRHHSVIHACALSSQLIGPTPSRSSRIHGTAATIQACSVCPLYYNTCRLQLIGAEEGRTNVARRWDAVEILRSGHAIFPLGTTQIRSARHQRARKKGDLYSSVLAGGVEERATHKVMHPGGSLLTPRHK